MDNEIRPTWQSPNFTPNFPGTERDSWKTAPGTPREDFICNIDAISEECETHSSDVKKSSREPYIPRRECNEKSEYAEHNSDIDGIDWRPGFKNQFPWIGFAGLVVIFVATATAVIILVSSHKKRVKDWPFYAIVTSGRYFNLVALAALMTKFAVVDSTLFQKATRTIVTQQKEYANSTMTGWVERDWPANFGGIPGADGHIKTVDAAWASVLDAYNGKLANSKVHDSLNDTASFFDCPYRQECSGAIEGLGFAFDCTTEYEDVDYGLRQWERSESFGTPHLLWDVKFRPSWASETKTYASIELEMRYVDSHAGEDEHSCPGTMNIRTCDIRPAVVRYPFTVMVPSKEELDGGNIVTHVKFFNDDRFWSTGTNLNDITQIDDLKVLNTAKLNEYFNETSTVGALAYIMNNLYESSANISHGSTWDIVARGASAQSIFYAESDEAEDRCWYNIKKPGRDDPTIELLRKLNTLSFVTSLYIKGAPTTDVDERKALGMASQNITISVTGIVEEYLTSSAYVFGALAATFITVILVLPVYWGFWQLGRKVTLGPLEISQAFGAPIIAPDKMKAYHGDFDQVLEDVGDRGVQYGQLSNAPPGQMGLAEPERVVVPKASHRWRVSGQRENRRIGLAAVFGGAVAATMSGNARD
ncbi:uncharacterized protein J4E88_006618 [Alternaria novae-zelandiae]|uniref:uncharacterized protein n=1 Tax=Alternaria novae-zelandiae TaxID=430562 RepID=UPI0020C1C8B2|nr:uncharacterized protein J4E88_006618 [Alternaria novae-zelandiae]KAI4678099.1 hypothetical protein J4E88_006618 [Alternaria novae-zelandiae]